MGRMPTLRAMDVISALQRLGFEIAWQTGSHITLKHSNGRTVRVPFHGSRDLGRGIVRTIIRDAGVTRQQFLDAL